MGLFSKKKKAEGGSSGKAFRRRSKEGAAVADDAKKAAAAAASSGAAAYVPPSQSGGAKLAAQMHKTPPRASSSSSAALKLPQSLPGEIHVRNRLNRQHAPHSPSDDASHVSEMSRSSDFPPTPAGYRTRTPMPSLLLPALDAETEEEESLFHGSRSIVENGRGPLHGASKAKDAKAVASKTSKTTKKTEKKKGNCFTNSKSFKDLSNWAFDTIDADKSGCVDKKELYTGLLMIHLKLATYAGPAACRPATREYVEKIFDKMDTDRSGGLDRSEFMDVMSIVCSQVFTRVIIQWSMTLMIVPMIAQLVISALVKANDVAWDFWAEMDELEPVRNAVGGAWDGAWDKASSATPGFVTRFLGSLAGLWDKIPEGVKETLPVTLMSCVLGCLAVPYMLYKIDTFYANQAEKKAKEKEVEL